jgi:cyclase
MSTLDSPALVQVSDRVWAWVQPDGTWWINNTGFVVGDDGVLVVDSCATATRTAAFHQAIDRVVDGPKRWAVNTHAHGDHTYGNSLLPAETILIGHELMRSDLQADPVFDQCPPLWEPVPDWGDVTRRVPSVTFRDQLTVHAGGVQARLIHPGFRAHTAGDVVVWVPDERVLFTGDLIFNGLTPLVGMGSVDGALRSLDFIHDFEADVVVPGHGPVIAGSSELAAVLATHEKYYRFVIDTARRGREQGLTPLEMAKRVQLGDFAHLPDVERIVPNLHRAYADASGGEVDIIAAMTDAVTWAGRPMHTHV